MDLATGEIVGFEVLARWNHPLSGIIGPDVFIPVAEEIGLIGRLSEQVIGDALREAAHWDPSIKISVNISPWQLADGWLAQRIVRILAETGFPAERLVVEITESSLFADIDLAQTIVTSLKNQGIRLALDDFGTGFSSLSHLRSLPFDIIKIDRSFVSNIDREARERGDRPRGDDAGQRACRCRCASKGSKTRPRSTAVIRLGCQIGQGWYFGKPMPADQARELLARARARRRRPASRCRPQRLTLKVKCCTARPAAGRREPHARMRSFEHGKSRVKDLPCSSPRRIRARIRAASDARARARARGRRAAQRPARRRRPQAVRDDLRCRIPVRVGLIG